MFPFIALFLVDPAALMSSRTAAPIEPRTSTVFRGRENESAFNLHTYLAHHGGLFYAAWSSAAVGEEDPDQHIVYATSSDGHTWSAPQILAPDPDGPAGHKRWITRGLFVENNRLRALGALVESADYDQRGRGIVWKNLALHAFTFTNKHWRSDGPIALDAMNNFPPTRIDGRYLMPARDASMKMSVLAAAKLAPNAWSATPLFSEPPFHRLDEPTLYEAADRTLHIIIRDGARSGRLLRVISTDRGLTWSHPVQTDFPDATSKNFVTRISTGAYVLINNPNPKARDPLSLALSPDGWQFSQPTPVRHGAPPRRYAGRAKGSGTFQYPHAIEHNGSLWIIYSTNKEDIEISEIPVSSLH
ncbi:MAG: exo-alpha-sialidase [Acidobacteria bacterium]|nr:exo-alpha-sialidase [Acidobacteriota bacterium]